MRTATVITTLLVLTVVFPTAKADEKDLLTGKELVEALRKGGYVLYMRHPQTNEDQADTDTMNLSNLKAQRHLSDKGREQARAFGEALKALKIPIAQVLTSMFYRAIETAKLADLGKPDSHLDLTEPQNVSPKEGKRRAAELRKILGTPPTAGTNVLIVGHRPCLQDAVGKDVGDMAEGECVIYKPEAEGKFKMIARVKIDSWSEWAKK